MTNSERAVRILGIMEKQKVTIVELTRRTKLARSTIRNVLDGKHNIGVDTMQMVAEALKISPKSLV